MDQRRDEPGVSQPGGGQPGPHRRDPDQGTADQRAADQRDGVQGANTVWTIISLLVAGPATWAAIGWLVDRMAGTSVLTPIGVVLGFVGSLYLVYMKYGRT